MACVAVACSIMISWILDVQARVARTGIAIVLPPSAWASRPEPLLHLPLFLPSVIAVIGVPCFVERLVAA